MNGTHSQKLKMFCPLEVVELWLLHARGEADRFVDLDRSIVYTFGLFTVVRL